MQFDRQITISAAGNRKAMLWLPQVLQWSDMVEKLRTPVRGTETIEEYFNLKKSQQDELKDVGGFVGGTLLNNRRKASNVTGRDIITLDLDNIPSRGTADVLRRLEGLNCAYVTYSTRKHVENAPRLRVVVPLNRTATADEYEPLARKLAAIIGISLADPTTFQGSRMMYWGSCSSNSQYVFQSADKPFLDVDGLLGTYNDWRNIEEWPQVPGSENSHVKLAAKQGDPLEKKGIVGAFCRHFTIREAMEKFLPGIYEPTDAENRLTYIGGSTAGGAITYEDKFLYSHHATDPCSGTLVNAFDLVRLHKFGELDDETPPGASGAALKSYTAMQNFAQEIDVVKKAIDREYLKKYSAAEDFGILDEEQPSWLTFSQNGKPQVNHYILAGEIIAEHTMLRTPRLPDGAIFNKETGLWMISGFREMLEKIITDKLGPFFSSHHMREVVTLIMKKIYEPNNNINPFTESKKPELVTFKNGTYNILTGELRAPIPEDYIFQVRQYEIDLDANKKATLTREWLEYLVGDASIFLMEHIGASFYSGVGLRGFAMLTGVGANGKSTFLNFTKSLIEDSNVTSLSLKQLTGRDNRFMTSRLYMKDANICADIPPEYIQDTGILKMITGGDSITGELKGQTPFEFVPWATQWFSSNVLPSFSDFSAGFKERAKVVTFGQKELGTNKAYMDKFHISKLEEEKPVFIRECCEMFRAAFKAGKYTETDSMKWAKDKWVEDNNVTEQFVKSCLIETIFPMNGDTLREVYGVYQNWCNEEGIKPANIMKRKSFKERMEELGYQVVIRRAHKEPREARPVQRLGNVYLLPNAQKLQQQGELKLKDENANLDTSEYLTCFNPVQ